MAVVKLDDGRIVVGMIVEEKTETAKEPAKRKPKASKVAAVEAE